MSQDEIFTVLVQGLREEDLAAFLRYKIKILAVFGIRALHAEGERERDALLYSRTRDAYGESLVRRKNELRSP